VRAPRQPTIYPYPASERSPTGIARGTPDALHNRVAIGSAPRSPREERELAAGVALGLLCATATLLIVLFATGAIELPRSTLPAYPPEFSEARPTPQWPFRNEWLTPRPKG
jgi:hypothetical protein